MNIYTACRNITAYYAANIAVVINISSLGGQETFGFLVGFVELFVVFILIGNIDVATCSKAGLTFLTGKAAALDVNITACRDRDILFACNIGSFYLFIHYLVMVVVAATTAAYLCFLTIAVLYGVDIHIATSI